jgi:predicted kinase
MATAHLIYGLIGSGKTTLAKRLEQEFAAVRFTPDDWMARLFGADPPEATFQEKAATILGLMEPLWTRCLSIGVDVVLDFGFWRRSERDRARELAAGVGARIRLYALECSDEIALQRVEARNGALQGSLYIAPATFKLLRHRIEPLGEDEPFITP